MNDVIILLHAKAYDFENKTDGKRVSGVKLGYIMTDNLNPISIDNSEKGYSLVESSINIDKAINIKEVPALYKPVYVQSINSKKQIIQRLIDVEYISPIQMQDNKK